MSSTDPSPDPVPIAADPWVQRTRYFLVNSVGAVVDLGVALLVNAIWNPPLWVSAALGVMAGSSVNYVAHELWTFGRGGRLSAKRATTFLLACCGLLLIRVAVVAGLESTVGALLPELAILAIAFGASFVTGYLFSSRLFRRT